MAAWRGWVTTRMLSLYVAYISTVFYLESYSVHSAVDSYRQIMQVIYTPCNARECWKSTCGAYQARYHSSSLPNTGESWHSFLIKAHHACNHIHMYVLITHVLFYIQYLRLSASSGNHVTPRSLTRPSLIFFTSFATFFVPTHAVSTCTYMKACMYAY